MSSKYDRESLLFHEWSIIHDNVKRFPEIVRESNRLNPRTRLSVYMVGNPRNALIVCNVRVKRIEYFKVFRVDIRDGSCETWLTLYDAVEWNVKKI